MRLSRPVPPDTVDLDNVDLVDSRLHGGGDPHSIWNAMRVRDPIRWQDVGENLGFWSVTKYDDADTVLRDHTRFTSQRGTMLFLLGKEDPARGRQMAATDPPRHTKMREPLQRALTAKSVERYSDAIRKEVRLLLAPAFDGGSFDFAQAMIQLPMAAAGTMMRLPREDWPRLTQLTTMSIAPDDPEISQLGAKDTLEAAHRELFAYFHDILRERRNDLGDDLISLLLTIEVDGHKHETGAILSNCYSLILGANVTTPYVPTGAVIEEENTPWFADLTAHPEVLNTAVDEAIRWASPANHFMRYALEDVTLRDKKISVGDAVVVWLGSANRDDEHFDDPFAFNIRRKPNRHITFGAGDHYCVGHTVARLSVKLLLQEMVAAFDSFERVGEVSHLYSNFVAGVKHLPIEARIKANARPLVAAR